jgi:hypothetical protein
VATIVGGDVKLALDPGRVSGGDGNVCDSAQTLLQPITA